MEQLLSVTYDASKYKTHEHWVESRMHTVEADALDQAEGDNSARTRYQRMFWEPVVEGQVCDPQCTLLIPLCQPLLIPGTCPPDRSETGTRRCQTTWANRGAH